MRRNIIVLGTRNISGNYGRVAITGKIIIRDSKIDRLYCAGESVIQNSSIRKASCAGDVKAEKSDFGTVKLAGEFRMKGVCKGDIISIDGRLSTEYLECRILKNGFSKGKAKTIGQQNLEWCGSIKAETFENYNHMNLDFDYQFTNIISYAPLYSKDEIVCDNFYSFGKLHTEAVNAENIYLMPQPDMVINSITGSNIVIAKKFQADALFKRVPKTKTYQGISSGNDIICIDHLEADNISIENTKAQLVSGNEVIIGELCIINRVEYRTKIIISEKAIVNEVIKL